MIFDIFQSEISKISNKKVRGWFCIRSQSNISKSISYHKLLSEKTTLNMNQLYLAWPNSCFYKHNSQCSHERGVSTEINPFLLVVGEERSGSVCRSSADQRSHHVNCQHRRFCSKIIFWPQIQCSVGPPKTCEKMNIIQNKQVKLAMLAPISSAIKQNSQ